MVFSSLIFIFIYLPVTLAVYYAVPVRWRNPVLFVLSLAFYGWGEPAYIALMLVSIASAYAFGFGIDKFRQTDRKKAKVFLALSLCVNLAFLLFFKYFNFFASLFGAKGIPGLTLPVGISFYTFQIMSYSVDLYRGEVEKARRFVPFGTYVTLFPQLIAGPIVRYKEICGQLTGRKETVSGFASGVNRFVCGLSKKLILGDGAAAAAEFFTAQNEFGGSVLGTWAAVIFYTFHIYFDFSGYSDMAIGLGRMFGFELPENFDHPYVSRSITEFWRRWHITLSTWFREYVYFPLGGSRKGAGRTYFNLAVVWFLTGFWHGAGWNYIIWGVYFLLLLVVEKAFLGKPLKKLPALGHLWTLFFVGIGWLIFFRTDIPSLFADLGRMFGAGASSFAPEYPSVLLRLLPFALLCAFACTGLPKKLFEKALSRFPALGYAVPFLTLALAAVCTAYMVDDTFSPFLYYIF